MDSLTSQPSASESWGYAVGPSASEPQPLKAEGSDKMVSDFWALGCGLWAVMGDGVIHIADEPEGGLATWVHASDTTSIV